MPKCLCRQAPRRRRRALRTSAAENPAYTGTVGCSSVNSIQLRTRFGSSLHGESMSWPSVTRMSRRFCPCQADGHAARYRRNAPCRRSDARRSALLLQRDSRWKTFNGIHIRHANLIKQSARIWCDGFEIPSLCLSEQSPEGKRRFSRAGHAGKHDERISRKVKIHVLQIMFAGAADGDEARSTRHLRHALTARE